jgi:hypothetical protein
MDFGFHMMSGISSPTLKLSASQRHCTMELINILYYVSFKYILNFISYHFFPGRGKIFLFCIASRLTLGVHPASYQMGIRGDVPRGIAAGA